MNTKHGQLVTKGYLPKEKMMKKGTHKSTNESRQLQINLLEMRCEQITRMIYGTKLEQHLCT